LPIGANALQVALTLNFGGEGVVPERRIDTSDPFPLVLQLQNYGLIDYI
jgi:hypothetical protein